MYLHTDEWRMDGWMDRLRMDDGYKSEAKLQHTNCMTFNMSGGGGGGGLGVRCIKNCCCYKK